MKVLVTGGAGYIGSHTALELLNAGHEVCVVDNLCNASRESLRRVEALTGRTVDFRELNILDKAALTEVVTGAGFDAVIHFAALKAVGESVAQPLRYYHNNITGTLTLCEVMREQGVKRIVFSSSATVYGDPHTVPITEDFPLQATNPYGRTKLMMEYILSDLHTADPDFHVALLRYFNPIGAHASGCIGEDPSGIPNNLLPYIAQVAVGRRETLRVYGNDYPTPDGTGVRDYIHVVDLAVGHLRALEKLATDPGIVTCNLGTGRGYSVLDVVKAFEAASGKPIPYEIVDRRPGDIAECYADPTFARQELGWQAERDIEAMCRDAWRWQSQNPSGYSTDS
ncbi:MAG: UDP-glucose 4-epimerase GalE [Verrucomicrobia bacterium]|nr:UDP-glucose 4-epimerase GalE [Verrucomicrobiota bacterium]MBT7067349.1 UDP-glucose 4-epimerase GalE [Verrucomicrobiota bacterium]MBT7700698.1 UDP-glucose 4-epimerase GalE [Verrucomicrobiota bacterium]